MALINTVSLENGLVIEDAYLRIEMINGYKANMSITVNTYVNEQEYIIRKIPVSQKLYNFVPSVEIKADNFFKQGYEYLKTLDEFENASNVPLDCSPD